MKIKDNRGKITDDLQAGDVVCFYDNDDFNKHYGLIVKDVENNFGLIDPENGEAFLGDQNSDFKGFCDSNAKTLIDELNQEYDHVEKVNTQLVIEDK